MFYNTLITWNRAAEVAFANWFSGRGALLRSCAWAIALFSGLVLWSSNYEIRAMEKARVTRELAFEHEMNARDARRFRLTQSSLRRFAASPDAEYFRVVIVGASENFLVQSNGRKVTMDLTRGLATELESRLSDVPGTRPVIIDASYPGTRFEDRYLLTDYATQLEPDLIILTTDLDNLRRVVRKIADAPTSTNAPRRQHNMIVRVGYTALRVGAEGPARHLDAFMTTRFDSFASRFSRSFRPWFVSPADIEFHDHIDDPPFALEHEGVELERFESQRIPIDPSKRSAAYSDQQRELLLENDVPNVARALEIVSAPAVAAGIPTQIMITPTRQFLDADDKGALAAFQEDLDDFKSLMQTSDHNAHVWNSGPEGLVARDEFTDVMHFENFEPLATRLIEVLHENALLPPEWKTP